jgi:protein-tyrosine phosphatase
MVVAGSRTEPAPYHRVPSAPRGPGGSPGTIALMSDVERKARKTARRVAFEACFNFRDLGGYETGDGRRVRWGLLFRSDTLHRLTPSDADTFRALGLRTVIDLRSRMEIDDHGRVDVIDGEFAWFNVPMLDNVKLAPPDPSEPARPVPEPLAPGEGYFRIVEQFGGSLAQVFSLLSGGGALPAVFHCTSGKDRTGIVAALVLDVLGVPEDVIVEDYVLTEEATEPSLRWIRANEPDFAAFLADIPPERRAANPEKIAGFLHRVRSVHGSAEQLLVDLGVGRDDLVALRARLLDG